jgi:hypothetical protein
MSEVWRPGHVFRPDVKTGIQLTEGQVKLWDRGLIVAEAQWRGRSWTFWHELVFADLFPQVAYWWFHSAWTQQVRVSRADRDRRRGGLYGYMQFVDEETPAQLWFWDAEQIAAPFPPFADKPGNLPLQIALCRLIAGLVETDDTTSDEWYTVTSLVHRDELAQVFAETWPETWYPSLVKSRNMRKAFCLTQGLLPDEEA